MLDIDYIVLNLPLCTHVGLMNILYTNRIQSKTQGRVRLEIKAFYCVSVRVSNEWYIVFRYMKKICRYITISGWSWWWMGDRVVDGVIAQHASSHNNSNILFVRICIWECVFLLFVCVCVCLKAEEAFAFRTCFDFIFDLWYIY